MEMVMEKNNPEREKKKGELLRMGKPNGNTENENRIVFPFQHRCRAVRLSMGRGWSIEHQQQQNFPFRLRKRAETSTFGQLNGKKTSMRNVLLTLIWVADLFDGQ